MAGNELINTLPDPYVGTFRSLAQSFWRAELPAILSRMDFTEGVVHSGGFHAPVAGLTSAAFSTDAFTNQGNHVTGDSAGGAVAITYSISNGTAWVVISAANVATLPSSNFQRVGTSNYYVDVTSGATQPALPADSAWLMQVTLAAGAITAVSEIATRRISGTETVAVARTVGATGVWIVTQRGLIQLNAALTFLGELIAPMQTIFAGASAISFLGNTRIKELFPRWWGALGDDSHDDTVAVQAALTAANTMNGIIVKLLPGNFKITAPLNIYQKTELRGCGKLVSILHMTHTGDGVRSTWPPNSSTAAHVGLRELAIYTLTASTGGGFVDQGGSFVSVRDCYLAGFKHQIIFDQTEIAEILYNEIEVQGKTSGIWLVNGPDHNVVCTAGFTHVITIRGNQFNCSGTGALIIDDGGGNHNILYNNFNNGAYGVVAANTSSINITGNFFEHQSAEPILLANGTFFGAAVINHHYSPSIVGNSFSTSSGTFHVDLLNALGGRIADNAFVGANAQTAMIGLSGIPIAQVLIKGNTKSPPSTGSVDKPFVYAGGVAARMAAQDYQQRLFTSHAAGFAAGTRTLTLRDMGFLGTLERPQIGTVLLIMNGDFTNPEYTAVTALTATTVTVVLATSKAADFLVFAADLTTTFGKTTNMGTATIVSGATTAVITHGLDVTPLASQIGITPTTGATNAVGSWWVDTITATQFTVHVTNNPGASGWAFSWSVQPLVMS